MAGRSEDIANGQKGGEATAGHASRPSCRSLRAAARSVEARIRRELPSADASQQDLLDRLAELVDIVESGVSPRRYRGLAIAEAALVHWLLDELRGQLVREWGLAPAGPSPMETVALLEALEGIRDELSASADQQLSRLLTSYRALDFLVELAHDLRSPLTSIIFLSEALRQQQSGRVNPLQSRQLGIVYTAALGLVSMASDVIELVRGDGLLEKTVTPFSIGELLESIRDLVDPIAETKALALRVRTPETDRWLGHPVALSRVMLNLTSNALKYTDKGSVEIGAREMSSSSLEFSVRDTGPGIDAAGGDRFSAIRVNSTGDRHGFSGSGLGLAICRRLLASMGTELRCESAPGQGTRFYFEVELAPG